MSLRADVARISTGQGALSGTSSSEGRGRRNDILLSARSFPSFSHLSLQKQQKTTQVKVNNGPREYILKSLILPPHR